MAIVSSIIESALLQKDGRKWVHEIHTDQVPLKHDLNYLANVGADLNAALAVHATSVGNALADNEMAANIDQILTQGRAAVIVNVYTTLSQLMNVARPMYATATGVAAVNLGDWFNTRSFVELQNAFGFANVTAYNTFKTQFFVPNANASTSVRTSVGG